MTESAGGIIGGVDTHADVHVAAAVCAQTQRLLSTASFPATPEGYATLTGWLAGFGPITAVGVEGTGSYGAGLARQLTGNGVAVIEVDRPDRAERHRRGKSDPIDAEAAARAVVAGKATGRPKSRDGAVEAIRTLTVVYRSAVKDRTAAINQFHALVVTAPDAIRSVLTAMSRPARMVEVRRWRPRPSDDLVSATTRTALTMLADRTAVLDDQIADLDARLGDLVEQTAPALLFCPGVGVHVAAQLLITFGDNAERITSEAAFAHLCGVAPIPASSGKTRRHRLNRGGDRQANNALWRIVMVRLSTDPRTQAYAQRRIAEGLSDRDVIRCLKRYVAREIHRVLTRPDPLPPTGPELRHRRLTHNLSQAQLAAFTGIPTHTISRIERRKLHNAQTQHHLADHLPATTP